MYTTFGERPLYISRLDRRTLRPVNVLGRSDVNNKIKNDISCSVWSYNIIVIIERTCTWCGQNYCPNKTYIVQWKHETTCIIITVIITVNLYSAFFVQEPQRAACASLVEREEKGFEVVLKRWKRKTTAVSKVSRKWVPIRRAGVCKWTSSVRSKFHTWEIEMTTVSRSQVATASESCMYIGWRQT